MNLRGDLLAWVVHFRPVRRFAAPVARADAPVARTDAPVARVDATVAQPQFFFRASR